ncbi:ArsR/SmtB family transcription factor [Pseudoduganella sp. OTU4001]|uniref:ArsR/SmtB family transcription factor n=1 Tax=Pseudoduganella sp. OTU4001 TaxID=3043854 RepID=UPI00313BDED8
MSSCCDIKPDGTLPAVDAEQVAQLCKALAHPARVQLLCYLASYGACYFGNLADVLPLSPSTISQHVSVLKEAGLILGSSDAQRVCYCINPKRIGQLKQLINAL